MKKLALLSTILALYAQIMYSQALPDQYLGLTPPGDTPIVFAPGIVSLPGRNERVITFSPSGHEIFFAIGNWPTRKTMHIEYKDNAWTNPEVASFSINRSAEEPFFSSDDNLVYYYAYPPSSSTNADICYSEKTGDTWSDPISVGSSLNTSGDEFHPNIVNDGSIYFANSAGKTYRAQYSDGSFLPRVILPNNVNSGVWPDHYISPDESYMIFTSTKTGGYGSSDLYVSFKNADGSWTDSQNLGNKINTVAYEGSADVTRDGKYMTYDNGADIYWVKIDNVIDSLKEISGVITSINTLPETQDLKIVPNPSTGLFNISFASVGDRKILTEICNLEGELIFVGMVENKSKINLSGNPPGIYIIRVYSEGKVLNKKIVLN
jgi:hypothetical protein